MHNFDKMVAPRVNVFGCTRKERLRRRAYKIAEAWQRQEREDAVCIPSVDNAAQSFMAGYRAAVADLRKLYSKADFAAGVNPIEPEKLDGIVRDFIKPMR